MKRLLQGAATLLLGAGLGAAGSRLLPPGGRQEEDDGTGLLSRVPVVPVVPVVQASELTVSSSRRHSGILPVEQAEEKESAQPQSCSAHPGVRTPEITVGTVRWEEFGRGRVVFHNKSL